MDAELVTQHPFLTMAPDNAYTYYKVPKSILTAGKTIGISSDEAILYSILRSRLGVSAKNGKIDGLGRIYIYYSRKNVSAYLGWSARKTTHMFQALKAHGLLEEQAEAQDGLMTGLRLFLRLWQDAGDGFSPDSVQTEKFPFASIGTLKMSKMGAYYELPNVLFEWERYDELPLRSILLYMLVLERLSGARRFHRVDKSGRLWTTLDKSIVLAELGCSERSLARSYQDLEAIGLIERQAADYGGSWRIYARSPVPSLQVQQH